MARRSAQPAGAGKRTLPPASRQEDAAGRLPSDASPVALEAQKLRLEIARLKRPWWRRASFLAALSPYVVSAALAGYLYATGHFDSRLAERETVLAALDADVRAREATRTRLIGETAELQGEAANIAETLDRLDAQRAAMREQLATLNAELTLTRSSQEDLIAAAAAETEQAIAALEETLDQRRAEIAAKIASAEADARNRIRAAQAEFAEHVKAGDLAAAARIATAERAAEHAIARARREAEAIQAEAIANAEAQLVGDTLSIDWPLRAVTAKASPLHPGAESVAVLIEKLRRAPTKEAAQRVATAVDTTDNPVLKANLLRALYFGTGSDRWYEALQTLAETWAADVGLPAFWDVFADVGDEVWPPNRKSDTIALFAALADRHSENRALIHVLSDVIVRSPLSGTLRQAPVLMQQQLLGAARDLALDLSIAAHDRRAPLRLVALLKPTAAILIFADLWTKEPREADWGGFHPVLAEMIGDTHETSMVRLGAPNSRDRAAWALWLAERFDLVAEIADGEPADWPAAI